MSVDRSLIGVSVRAVRTVERRLPWPARRAGRALRGVRRRGLGGSALVTAVVAVSGRDVAWLSLALDSLRDQSHRDLEIVVVPYGDASSVLPVARDLAEEDWRARVGPASATLASAFDAGAATARGRYLCFLDPRDLLPHQALALLVRSLERTGSDLAVGRGVRLPMPRPAHATPDPVHGSYRAAVTIEDFPMAVADTGVGNRLFRTRFWRERGLTHPEPGSADRLPLAVDAHVSAQAFDVLPDVTYQRMNRGDAVAFGTLVDAMVGLEDWLTERRPGWAGLERLDGGGPVRDAWAYVLCEVDVVPFLDDVERADDAQWAALRDFLGPVVERIGVRAWERVRAETKLKLWLLTEDRRADLEDLVSQRWFSGIHRPTEVVQGKVRAVLPIAADGGLDVPASCLVMSEDETPARSVLRGARWLEDGRTLELDLYAWVDFVEDHGQDLEVQVDLVHARTGERTATTVHQREDPDVTLSAGHRHQRYSAGACTVRVDLASLRGPHQEHAGGDPLDRESRVPHSLAEWWPEVRLCIRDVARSAPLGRRDDRGSVGQLGSAVLGARDLGTHRLHVVPDDRTGIRLAALPPLGLRLVSADVDGRTVTGTLRGAVEHLTGLTVSRADGVTARAVLGPGMGGVQSFRLELPADPPGEFPPRVWRMRALEGAQTEHPVSFSPEDPDVDWLGVGPRAEMVLGRTGVGTCEVVDATRTVLLDEVTMREHAWRVAGRWLGPAPPAWSVRLRNKRVYLPAETTESHGVGFSAEIPLTWSEWGLKRPTLPSGLYFIEVLVEDRPVRVVLAPGLVGELLGAAETPSYRGVLVCHGREPAVKVSPPRRPDERGAYGQEQLETWFRTAEHPVDPHGVYLQSYTGGAATDSQRALHDELRRTRPELVLHWGVADLSVPVPEGGVPVVIGSREWYRVLATSTYLCNNIDFDRWFFTRPGQRLLQTFHGYPAKSMGIRLWRAKHFTERRIAAELERTSRDWDLILTPAPEMDVHYRTEYRYEGPIESAGYPRDDVLVSPEADGIRSRTRALLGIEDHQSVVLYAPTWRDDLATSYRSAPIVRHLDLDSASEQLGEDFVFLMRGHRFHAKGDRRTARTARLIDVTDYPEVNDLILASDAAVLDYSSLRFDFALTGRPMLFLVPDLGDYTGGVRGFLYPFTSSAPGPLLEDAEEVVTRLRDLDGLRAEYAEEYAQFNARFNAGQDGHAAERVARRFFS